ncbi:helix-turn-helix transcriptional regulator [Alkalicaulis satelles]|nr:helix-turn-helix transcriptional regulator [Alkalicaulis satelles]
MKWGEALRAFRARNNIKQEAAADMLGVSQAYISRLETGAQSPSADVEIKLQALLSEPAHRPVCEYIKALVSHSPYIMFLLSHSGGDVWVEAASQKALHMAGKLDAMAPALVVGEPLGMDNRPESFHGIRKMIEMGGFDGQLAFIDVIWHANLIETGELVYFRNTLVPVRGEQARWYIHGTTRVIKQEQYDRLWNEWEGPVLCYDFEKKRVRQEPAGGNREAQTPA